MRLARQGVLKKHGCWASLVGMNLTNKTIHKENDPWARSRTRAPIGYRWSRGVPNLQATVAGDICLSVKRLGKRR